ncbi:hypothetical protein FQB35_10495 [Crassaminicella thermophila]|uniref:Uncharacterized protein n=1 Tax=Crassaminicella thermophila TaxID=2599308 RepID=A0A5C0SDU0_CRATE|nr:hypothetical protein [Crassaminicella thermophila]QEK12725.1 hypothetical protein FQB35_10495 [Crassaminicella thermophila]
MIDTNMIGFDGIGAEYATFASNLDPTSEGKVVKVSASKTVALAAADDVFHGKAVKVEKDGAVTTQFKGYVECVYSGVTDPTIGYTKLSADADGGVKVDATNGREYLVLFVDTTNKIVGFIL